MEQQAVNRKAEEKELQEQMKRQKEINVEIQAIREKGRQARSDLANLEAELKAEEIYQERLKTFQGLCPVITKGQIACQTKEVLEAVAGPQQQSTNSGLKQRVAAAIEEIKNLQEQLKNLEAKSISLGGGITFVIVHPPHLNPPPPGGEETLFLFHKFPRPVRGEGQGEGTLNGY